MGGTSTKYDAFVGRKRTYLAVTRGSVEPYIPESEYDKSSAPGPRVSLSTAMFPFGTTLSSEDPPGDPGVLCVPVVRDAGEEGVRRDRGRAGNSGAIGDRQKLAG